MGNMVVLTPVESGPSQPDLTQEARKIELSVLIVVIRLPSPCFMPEAAYQLVLAGEQPVAFNVKGNPRQALTSLTACVGAVGNEVILSITSFEARVHMPVG